MPLLIKKDPDTIKSYFEDSSNLKGGCADEVVFPKSLDELSGFLRAIYPKRVPITISGGGTGTAGSRIPFGGIVISMERFNSIIGISNDTMSAMVQAGVMVEDLKNACERKGLFYTSHPTEKTAFVGGTVATNASGARSFKYGPTRKYVNYLKMVLSNGEIFEVRRGEKFLKKNDSRFKLKNGTEIPVPLPAYKMPDVKNSAGYYAKDGMDLIDLFIGQEGTLSIIVDIGIELVKKPSKIFSAFVFFRKEEDAWHFAKDEGAKSALSIEYFDSNAVRLLRGKNRNVPQGVSAAIFFEQEGDFEREDMLTGKWLKLVSKHNASLDDTWVDMSGKEAENFIELRHSIPESINDMVRRSGFQKLSTDISVPSNRFFEMMNFYVDTFRGEKIEHVSFGHIGENHVHVNLLPESEEELVEAKEICLEFNKKGVALGGTVSAEHGIGKTRHKYLEIMYGKEGVLDMARIKKAIDPNCVLGLGNIFPREVLNLA